MSSSISEDETIQRKNWEYISHFIDGLIDKLDLSNVEECYWALFKVNFVRARRVLIKSILNHQEVHAKKSILHAALVTLINSVDPGMGEELAKEATSLFLKGYERNDKRLCYTMIEFIAELFNYEVVHEILILQIFHLLTENLNESSSGLVILFMTLTGKRLSLLSKTAHNLVYERLRSFLQEETLKKETSERIECLFDLRRRNYPSTPPLLNLPKHNIFTHTLIIDLDKPFIPTDTLEAFDYDPNYFETEEAFEKLRAKVLAENQAPTPNNVSEAVRDKSEANDLQFKKKIYLVLKGSLSGDEAAHKLLKLRVNDREKDKIAEILVLACSQEVTYSKFYGVISERLCCGHRSWQRSFRTIFRLNYVDIDNLEAKQIRNIGKFWGHLLASDYVGFEVMQYIHITEDETTSAGRVFLKFLFQELVAELGLCALKERLEEPYVQPYLRDVFPINNMESVRFSVNFFTAIGLGGLTDTMRERLLMLEDSERVRSSRRQLSEQFSPRDAILSEAGDNVDEMISGDGEEKSKTMEKDPEVNRKSVEMESASRERGQHLAQEIDSNSARNRARTQTRRSRSPVGRRSRTPIRKRSRSPPGRIFLADKG